MANMYDYLRWRGDLTFAERPFDDVDNLILASISYFDFSGIVPGEKSGRSIKLSDACQKLLQEDDGSFDRLVRSMAKLDAKFVKLVGSTNRFGQCDLSAYVDIVDESRALQFSAMQIDLPGEGVYISYRGTDNTLVGWREDFISGFKVTEAQREAALYLSRAVARVGVDCPAIRVGGHSKGGNLAEFAATSLPDEQRERITCVYSNDGPGLAPGVIARSSKEVLGDRLRRIVPTYSIIGMLFAKPDDPLTVTLSSSVGIGQHDPTTWQVGPTGVREAAGLLPDCKLAIESIARWGEKLSVAEREQLTNELFDALAAGGATTFDDILTSSDDLQKVLKALGKLSDSTKDVAMALLESMLSVSADAMRKATNERFEALRKKMLAAAGETTRKLFGQQKGK